MKKLTLLILIMSTLLVSKAQNAILTKDGNYTSVSMSNKKTPVNTGKTYTDVDKGIVYPIYITDKGKLFIIKESVKSKKKYRSYLKIVK